MIQNSTVQLEQTSDKTNITFLEENLVLLKNVLVRDLLLLDFIQQGEILST